MKKLIALLMILVLVLPAAAMACEDSAVLPKTEGLWAADCGYAYVALSHTTRQLFGKLREDERVDIYPAQNAASSYVRGITAGGVNREKGEMRFLANGETACGLTKVMASVQIREEYREIVGDIVIRRIGKDAEMTAASILACTLYRTQSTVSHYMYDGKSDKVAIGGVMFAGADAEAILYLGDWNVDGLLDIGFAVNLGSGKKPEPKPSPEPEKMPDPVVIVHNHYITNTTTSQSCTKVTNEIIQDNRQININSWVMNNQKQIVTVNPKRGCQNQTPCMK